LDSRDWLCGAVASQAVVIREGIRSQAYERFGELTP